MSDERAMIPSEATTAGCVVQSSEGGERCPECNSPEDVLVSIRGQRGAPTEDQEQRTVCQWLDLHQITYIHVPNGGKRARIEAAIFVGLGVKKGFPDLLVFNPPPRALGRVGAAIEMKRRGREREPDGGLSPDQKEWLDRLARLGWATRVAYGADEAIEWLESLGYGRRCD